MDDLRYPIGEYHPEAVVSPERRAEWIAQVSEAPVLFRAAAQGLSEAQLDTPYRPGGWTLRQVVHHVPDSHLNAYCRFKLALTEDSPTIKPYAEARWAELPDTAGTPIGVSLTLLDAVHRRWVVLLRALGEAEWARDYVHPEQGRRFRLDEALGLYAWHGRHHTAHLATTRKRLGWS